MPVSKAATRLADSGSFVLVRSAEVRWRCSTSGGPRERADDNARVRRGPGGSVADRPEARARTRADDARVTAFELPGDRPRAAALLELRLRAEPTAGIAAQGGSDGAQSARSPAREPPLAPPAPTGRAATARGRP